MDLNVPRVIGIHPEARKNNNEAFDRTDSESNGVTLVVELWLEKDWHVHKVISRKQCNVFTTVVQSNALYWDLEGAVV